MSDVTEKQRNLKPWTKGTSGNPKGRPKKEHCIVNLIEQYLVMTPEQLKAEATKEALDLAHRLAVKYILDCHEHPNHTDKLMDRLYGQAATAIDVTSKGQEIKGNNVFQIVSEETKTLMQRIETGERAEHTEINNDLSEERKSIFRP